MFAEPHRLVKYFRCTGDDCEKGLGKQTKISQASGSNSLSKHKCDRDPGLVSMFIFPQPLSVN